MNLLAVTEQHDERISTRFDAKNKIISFGADNLYPQMVESFINKSGTASSCAEIYEDFILGDGFEDEELNQYVINRSGETLYDLLTAVAHDIARHKGFAWHINYNLLGEGISMKRLKFRNCRLGEKDSKGYAGMIAYSTGWKRMGGYFNRDKANIALIHKFNPLQKVLFEQIRQAGTIQQFSGHVMYWTPEPDVYPLSPFDAVLEDIDTDAQVKVFKNNGVRTNFMTSHIYKYFGSFEGKEGEEEKAALEAELKKFQGAKGKKIMIAAMGTRPTDAMLKASLLESVDNQHIDGLYKYTEESCRSNIIDSRKIPQALFSKFDSGSLGQSSKIFAEAAEQYNRVTSKERQIIKRQFEKVARVFPDLRDRDFTIKKKYTTAIDEYLNATKEENNATNNQTGF